MSLTQLISENLAGVQQRVAAAAQRSGRTVDTIKLVGVTKYVGVPETDALIGAGCDALGESRPQALQQKVTELSGRGADWHLVGHLQRNKIRKVLPLVSLIHSLDSEKLLFAIDRIALELRLRPAVLIEVNVSGDTTKHGVSPTHLEPLLQSSAQCSCVQIRGLMTMASLVGGRSQARRDFASLRELRDDVQQRCPDSVMLNELSMGMSGDFEVGIEEGATLVRVGSSLFAGVPKT